MIFLIEQHIWFLAAAVVAGIIVGWISFERPSSK